MLKRFYALIMTCTLVGIISFYMGYNYNNTKTKKEGSNTENNIIQNSSAENISEDITAEKETENIPVNIVKEDTIEPYTKMVYKIYYVKNDEEIISEEEPPYFLLGLNKDELVNNYPDLQVDSFSDKEVVISKRVEEKSPNNYIVGEYRGFVAIYWEGTGELKEVTDTPISSLSKEEQDSIKHGLYLYGEKELIEFLQDYSS